MYPENPITLPVAGGGNYGQPNDKLRRDSECHVSSHELGMHIRITSSKLAKHLVATSSRTVGKLSAPQTMARNDECLRAKRKQTLKNEYGS